MAAPTDHALFNTFDNILPLINKPEELLVHKNAITEDYTKALKCMYDVGYASSSLAFQSDNTLSELTVSGFDDEQIWQQIDLENNEAIKKLISISSSLLTSKTKCIFQTKSENSSIQRNQLDQLSKKNEVEENVDDIDEFQDDHDSDVGSNFENDDDDDNDAIDKNDKFFDFTGDSDDDLNYGTLGSNGDMEDKIFEASDSDDRNDDHLDNSNKKKSEKTDKKSVSFEDDIEKTTAKTKKRKLNRTNKAKGSVVDDAFFKLADMAEFLDREDLLESKKGQEKRDESDDEEDIDLFGDIGSEDEDLHYDDFFDPPDIEESGAERKSKLKEQNDEDAGAGEDSDEEDDEEPQDIGDKEDQDAIGVRQALQRSLLSDSGSEGEDVADILGGARKTAEKSSFEIRQEKLNKKITEMEEKLLAEKPWQLTGEVNAGKRPENSLLQENLQFEYTTRLPPEITEETTQTLEDLIKQRIKDKAWDDVERKVKPTENPFEFKKRITLDQEKSKMSLGEIYEQEYLKQQQTEQVEKTDPDHESIKKMMTSLFVKLDALSNFHYTPKQAAPEVQIITNQPSIAMEEVAPVAVSDAKLLAPEEIKDKVKGELKGDSEKTKTDRLRERQKKKKEKRIKRKEKEQRQKLIEKLNPGLGNKYSKDRALRELEKESKTPSSRVTLLKDNKEKSGLTSSKNFFSQLQEEVSAGIKSKQVEKRKLKVDTSKIGGKKFKL